MAKITSKTLLAVGTELTVNTATLIITLNVAGNLVAKDGVSWQALYSKMVDLWTTATYNDFPFPFYALDVLSGQYLMGTDGATNNGWKFSVTDSNASRGYMRDGGWSEYNSSGVLSRQYSGIISLGTVSSGSQLYYQTTSTGTPTNFIYTDASNQGVQVYGDAVADPSTTTFDTRTFFKGFVREYAKKYKDSILADTGKTATGAYIVNMLLSNETDLDIQKPDAYVAAAIAVVTGTSWSAGVATITANAHGFANGDTVNITGVTPTGYNVSGIISGVTTNTFTIPITANPGVWTSGGSVGSIYSMINVKYFPTAFNKDIDTTGSPRAFGIVVDVGTHSAVDGVTNGTALITTAAGGIIGANYVGGTVVVHTGAGKGTYTISGTPTATNVVTTTVITGTASGISFTLQRAAPIPASLQQIYTKVQYQLRQNSNINGLASAGSVTGKTGSLALNFVGSALKAGFYAPTNPNGGGTGVTIQGYASSDVNSFTSYDNTATTRDYPYASAGALNANANLTSAGTGYYRMYFTTNPTGNYGTSTAVTVNDASGSPITGTITAGVINFTFDYTGNIQGGRTGGTDAAVTIVAGNAGKAKPVVATGTLTASKSISISMVAETDRAYL
jgi:hypothetical protein